MNKYLSKFGFTSVLNSIFFLIIGAILFFNPVLIINLISTILGVVFILAGITKIINYFIAKDSYAFYSSGLLAGLVAICIGIATMYVGSAFETLLRIIFGIWIIYSSLLRFEASIYLRKSKSPAWLFMLIISVLMFLFGLYILLTPGIIIATLGIFVMIFAIMDFIESIIFITNMKNFFK